MHASAAESLLPFLRPGSRVLDIGSGSGYLTHVLAELVKGESIDTAGTTRGNVVGVEHIQALTDMGLNNMRKSAEGRQMLESGQVRFVLADGRKGWTGPGGEEGWDAVHVGAAAVEIHQELVDQLRRPGR